MIRSRGFDDLQSVCRGVSSLFSFKACGGGGGVGWTYIRKSGVDTPLYFVSSGDFSQRVSVWLMQRELGSVGCWLGCFALVGAFGEAAAPETGELL